MNRYKIVNLERTKRGVLCHTCPHTVNMGNRELCDKYNVSYSVLVCIYVIYMSGYSRTHQFVLYAIQLSIIRCEMHVCCVIKPVSIGFLGNN